MGAQDQSVKVELRIDGMHCSGCARAVERALSGVRGVSKVSVDLTVGHATVIERGVVRDAGLIAAVERAGYRATRLD